jgi:DNA-binding Lrp family transcriptional regulator
MTGDSEAALILRQRLNYAEFSQINGGIMVTAVVLMNIRRGQVNPVAEKLAAIPGISEVYSVAGRYDLVAIVRVRNNEEMADLVTNQLLQVDGIENTETLLAFRAYSRHDLENMFAIGL